MLGFSAQLALAFMLFAALLALPCAIVLTLALIRWFRSRVARSMHATAGIISPAACGASSGGPHGALEIEWIYIGSGRAGAARVVPLVASTQRHAWQLAAIYAAAAAAYAFVLATAIILANGFAPTWNPILALARLYVVYILPFGGTPLMLAPTVVLRRQPRFLILAVLGLIGVMWALDRSIGVNSIGLWLLIAAVPTAAVLLLNARRLRAVGPIVFAATLLLLYGLVAGVSYAALYVIGPFRFVREDLRELPLVDAGLAWLRGLSLEQMLKELLAAAAEPAAYFQADNPQALPRASGCNSSRSGLWLLQ